jgi:hypothetical protein
MDATHGSLSLVNKVIRFLKRGRFLDQADLTISGRNHIRPADFEIFLPFAIPSFLHSNSASARIFPYRRFKRFSVTPKYGSQNGDHYRLPSALPNHRIP